MNSARASQYLKKLAADQGFDFCGISKARFLEEEAARLEDWLKRGKHGKMAYLERNFDKRLDPRKLVPGARSVVSLAYNYFPKTDLASNGSYKIAKYAYGKDYHFVIKGKLKQLLKNLESVCGCQIEGRAFVDSAPVHERAWAAQSGIGWIGKNTLLLNRQMGSFFFLAELIIDLELQPDSAMPDYCGTCKRCQEACPTDALHTPYELDATRCISYLTIELKDEIPSLYHDKLDDWIFGCDICQDVCPWNRFSRSTQEEAFRPVEGLGQMNKRDWEEMTEEIFRKRFKSSPLKRAKYSGMMRNVAANKK